MFEPGLPRALLNGRETNNAGCSHSQSEVRRAGKHLQKHATFLEPSRCLLRLRYFVPKYPWHRTVASKGKEGSFACAMKDSTGSPEVSEVSKIGVGTAAGCSSREAPSAEGVKNAVDAVVKIVGDG